MLKSQLTRVASAIAPERVATLAANRKFDAIRRDGNQFRTPSELYGLLPPYELVSFDLFDTLVWRSVALEDVHRKTAEFADRFIPGDRRPLPRGLLLHARERHQEAIKAAGMARADYRNEVDLVEVFDTALSPYIRDDARRAKAVEAIIAFEIETERQVLVVDPEMRGLLQKLRDDGKKIILTSDMYFSERWLRKLLEDLGLLPFFDRVFVSATVGVTKHSGLLFDHVDNVLASHTTRRLHVGDNWNNDVVQPRGHGWDALHYFNPTNEKRKDKLERLTRMGVHQHPDAAKVLTGAIEQGDGIEPTLRLVSAAFLAFSRQVLERAQTGQFDRVMFLTRDGTIFHHIIDQIIADSGASGALDLPKLEELAFSRRAGVLLACPVDQGEAWSDYIEPQVKWMLDAPATLGNIIRAFGLNDNETAPLGDADRGMDFDTLMTRPDLVEALHEAILAKRQRAADYLDQRGVFSADERILMVDIGYSGTVLKAMSEHLYHLEQEGLPVRSQLEMMMFAGNRFFIGNLGQLHPRATMVEPKLIGRDDWRARAVAFNFAWLEPFAVDRSRGSLRDYVADADGIYQPEFGPGSNEDSPVSRARVLAAARDVDAVLRTSPLSAADADAAISAALVTRFAHPRRATLQAVNGITHQAGLADITEDGILTRIRLWRIRSDLSRCLAEDRWIQGSLSASRLGWLNAPLNRIIGLISK